MLKRFCLAVTVLLFSLSPASALSIHFDYSYDRTGFFNWPDRRAALQEAGSWFGSHLSDNLKAITPGGTNTWVQTFEDPGTGVTVGQNGSRIPADTIVIFVGGADLPSSTLGEGVPGGYYASGDATWINSFSTRGQISGTTSKVIDFALWGGTITFNLTTTWYTGRDTSPDEPFAGYDLYSVALHEIAHVLGVGTGPAFFNQIDSQNNVFKGTAATAVAGANPPLTNESHLSEGIESVVFGTSIVQEAALDPTLDFGVRKQMTDLDMAMLSDVGWNVVPEPTTAGLVLIGVFGLVARRHRVL